MTFADGQVWINNDQVNAILKVDGCEASKDGKLKSGDVIVYADGEGNIEDSKTVTKVDVRNGPTVYGQGSLEETNSEKPIAHAWQSPTGTTSIFIGRNTTPNKVVSKTEAAKLIKNTQQNDTQELEEIQDRKPNVNN